MKNKIMSGLAAFAVAGSMLMGVAPASGGQSAQFAEVYWEDPVTGTNASVYADEKFDQLILSLQTYIRDANGNVIGSEVYLADANLSPYGALKVNKNLATATVSVTDVPAQRCTYDLNFEVIGECEFPAIDAQATFTGVGDISRKPVISRQATATGTVAGTAFTDAQVPLGCEEDVCGLRGLISWGHVDSITRQTGGSAGASMEWANSNVRFAGISVSTKWDEVYGLIQTFNPDGGYTEFYFDRNLSRVGTFRMDKNLNTASLYLPAVPASRCEFDADGEFIECAEEETPIVVQATWTGVGPVDRTPDVGHYVDPDSGCTVHYRGLGPSRNATGTASIAGVTLTAADSFGGDMNNRTFTQMTKCPSN